MLVISVQGCFEQAKKTIQAAGKIGDLIEIRVDLLEKQDVSHVSKLKAFSKVPVILTVRRKDQGGAYEGNEREREALLIELAKLKPTYIDLEWDSTFAEKIESPLICSYHNFEETPKDLEEVASKMERFPAKIKKIATMAHSSIDALRMLAFVQRAQVAGMCMGVLGQITRILAPIAGAPLVYAFVGKESAPGQLSAEELVGLYSFHQLSSQTKIYGLIGDPVSRSIGHLCHNYIFKKGKVNGVYVKILLKPTEVSQFFETIHSLPFYGLSVTMPLKEKVGPYLEKKEKGAINTLSKLGDKWVGTNTDGPGALDALEKKGKVKEKVVVILGAGGTAKGIAHEAADRGAKVVIANRTLEKGKRVAASAGGIATSLQEVPEYDILINTTPVGMAPDAHQIPIGEDKLFPNKHFFDVVMSPKETRFLNLAKSREGETIYGYEMYAQQALRQLKEWMDLPLEDEEILSSIESFAFL